MVTNLSYRITEIATRDFDPMDVLDQLRGLKRPYAASVYSAVTRSSHSEARSMKDLAAEAAADVAAKQVRVMSLELLEKEKLHLSKLENEKRQTDESVEAQRRKLEWLRAKQELEESNAKLKVLNAAVVDDSGASVNEMVVPQPLHHDVLGNQELLLNADAPAFVPYVQPPVHPMLSSNTVNESSLATAFANAIDRNRLPVPTPKVFSGNPLDFVTFRRSFKTLVESKNVSAEEKVYYLQQYVAGEAKEAISGCFYGSNEADYQHAWDILEKCFGHSFKIQEAFGERLDKWPKVGSRDSNALQKYADFLRTCLDAVPHVKDLHVLNDCKENQRMAAKLHDWAITRWSRIVANAVDVSEYPTFNQFVTFVEREVGAACNPIASVHAIRSAGSSSDSKAHMEVKGKSVRSLATDQFSMSDKGTTVLKQKNLVVKKFCPFCKEEHYLPDCKKFAAKDLAERNAFIKQGKRCFSCLRIGHFAKQCKARHTCKKCKGQHPTVLHNDDQGKEAVQQSDKVEKAASLNADLKNSSTTNVLPVWVSLASSPEEEILVYALLDTQSDSTFIDEAVCEKLSVPREAVKLKLSTLLGKDVTIASNRASNLRVRGYTSTKYIDLSLVYTRDFIPLDREHIPTCDTARRWNHLSGIAAEMPPLLDCEVGLLIGYDCSAALAPRRTIIGDDGQPYAVKTDLGWSIVGSLMCADILNASGCCYRTSVKEMPPIMPQDVLKVLESDFKDTDNRDECASQEDVQFLRILDKGIVMNAAGHLEMPLPFKSRPHLPNNRQLAIKRLAHLKQRFNCDSKYAEQYSKFIEQMLIEGDAELADEAAKPGEVCYIPHHGVYHPKKPDKLRVVFDCSARFQGHSLNDHLLSGPDLTNSLLGVLCRFRRYPIAIMCDVEKCSIDFMCILKIEIIYDFYGGRKVIPTQSQVNIE